MSKLTKLLLVLLVPFSAAIAATEIVIWSNTYTDGAKMEWACPEGTKGITHYRFTTNEGTKYTGSVSCGESV